MKFHLHIFFTAWAVIFLFVSGCAKKEETHSYTEIVIDSPLRAEGSKAMGHPPIPGMSVATEQTPELESPAPTTPLMWQVPSGWTESKGDGMRLVSFKSSDSTSPIDCSIVTLGGVAGGVKANIVRWLGQLQLATPSDEALEALLSKQPKFSSKGNLNGMIIDFAQLQADKDEQTASMISAIVELPQNVVFVKMTGSKAAIQTNKDKFMKLCQSLEWNQK